MKPFDSFDRTPKHSVGPCPKCGKMVRWMSSPQGQIAIEIPRPTERHTCDAKPGITDPTISTVVPQPLDLDYADDAQEGGAT